LQLAIEALPTIIDKAPETRLTVIGTGPYGDELKRAATSHGMEDYVDFRGVMNYEDLIETLGVMGIALAPYKPDTNAMVRFTDPGKVKEYLGCGLPVIITRVPDIALEIEKRELGIVIDYDKSQFAQAVLTLMEDKDLYLRFRENALSFASKFEWTRIFDDAIAPTLVEITTNS
jgi:glycosyltransferase involved in cell wall biosynthesis